MSILMVTGVEGARNCAAVVSTQLGMEVEVAEGRKASWAALRRREFSVIVVDETIAECDPAAAERIWEHAGLAIPLQINFALSGAARLIREIRAALHRRANVDAKGVHVTVHGNVATLSGAVSSFAEDSAAWWAASAAPGIERVVDHLTVRPAPVMLGRAR